MEVKIYVLKDPNTKEIRYIGRTKNSLRIRLNSHWSKARRSSENNHKNCWIKSLNEKPTIELLEIIEGWSESYIREQEIIKDFLIKGFNLVNAHDRGEGGLLRNVTKEQRLKISNSVKKLHDEGKLTCGRKAVDVYDLQGNFITSFSSYKECSEFIGISEKQFQSSMRRKAKRVKNFQVVQKGDTSPTIWKQRTGEISKNFKKLYIKDVETNEILEFEAIKKFKEFFNVGASTISFYRNTNKLFKDKYLVADARLKLCELLETPEEDNQQPSDAEMY